MRHYRIRCGLYKWYVTMTAAKNFTIDKHIPIALLFAIFAQTCGVVWYAAKLTANVEALQEKVVQESSMRIASTDDNKAATEALGVKIDDISTRIARIEGMLAAKGGITP